MNRYYLIDTSLEQLLKSYQAQWLQSSEKAYTVITGCYICVIIEAEEQAQYTSILKQNKVDYIESSYTYLDESGLLYKCSLEKFILEINPLSVPENIYNLLNNTEGITGFTSSSALKYSI